MSAVAQYEEIVSHAAAVADDTAKTLPADFAEGAWCRQGDIYLYFFRQPPYSQDAAGGQLISTAEPNAQLAVGDTQGSRHVLSSLSAVEMFSRRNADALEGPVFLVREPVTVEHPEHGDIRIEADALAAGPIWVIVTYQRDYAEELRATRD
jgi:hypothetical protein